MVRHFLLSFSIPLVHIAPDNNCTLPFSAALGGKVQLPATTIQLRPKTVVTTSMGGTQSVTGLTTGTTSSPGLKPIAPNVNQVKGTHVNYV